MATRSRTHTLESRVNSRLGNGSMRKSSWVSRLVTSPCPPRTSSLRTPGGQQQGELLGTLVAQGRREVGAQRVPEVQARHRAGDGVVTSLLALQGLREQVGQVEDLDVAVAQRLGERVVLVLGAAHPRHAVEEQLVVVARGESLKLGPGAVQHHRPQPSDLAVGTVDRLVRHTPQGVTLGRSPPGSPPRGADRPRTRCSAAPTAACSAAAPFRRAPPARRPPAGPTRRR